MSNCAKEFVSLASLNSCRKGATSRCAVEHWTYLLPVASHLDLSVQNTFDSNFLLNAAKQFPSFNHAREYQNVVRGARSPAPRH